MNEPDRGRDVDPLDGVDVTLAEAEQLRQRADVDAGCGAAESISSVVRDVGVGSVTSPLTNCEPPGSPRRGGPVDSRDRSPTTDNRSICSPRHRATISMPIRRACGGGRPSWRRTAATSALQSWPTLPRNVVEAAGLVRGEPEDLEEQAGERQIGLGGDRSPGVVETVGERAIGAVRAARTPGECRGSEHRRAAAPPRSSPPWTRSSRGACGCSSPRRRPTLRNVRSATPWPRQ